MTGRIPDRAVVLKPEGLGFAGVTQAIGKILDRVPAEWMAEVLERAGIVLVVLKLEHGELVMHVQHGWPLPPKWEPPAATPAEATDDGD